MQAEASEPNNTKLPVNLDTARRYAITLCVTPDYDLLPHRLYPLVDILMPMSFIQPALLLALPIQLHWSRWNASYWDSLVLMAPSFMAFRVALIVCMHFLLRNIKQARASRCCSSCPCTRAQVVADGGALSRVCRAERLRHTLPLYLPLSPPTHRAAMWLPLLGCRWRCWRLVQQRRSTRSCLTRLQVASSAAMSRSVLADCCTQKLSARVCGTGKVHMHQHRTLGGWRAPL